MGCFIFGGGGKKVDGDNLNFSQVTMEPQFGLAGKKFFNKNKELKTGTILNWDGTPLTLMDGDTIPGADVIEPSLTTRYIPSGKYLGKPVKLAPMAQGSVTGARLDDYTFRITKTAGYIPSGTEDYAVPPRVYHDGLVTLEAVSSSRFRVWYGGFTNNAGDLFAIDLIANGSVANGKVAAMSLNKQLDGTWSSWGKAYKVGTGYISPKISYTSGPTGTNYLYVDINQNSGDTNYCEFATTISYSISVLYWGN